MKGIQPGDQVKHRLLTMLNGGIPFNVVKVDGVNAWCEFINGRADHEGSWFLLSDLMVIPGTANSSPESTTFSRS
jgi:hypothetical protein